MLSSIDHGHPGLQRQKAHALPVLALATEAPNQRRVRTDKNHHRHYHTTVVINSFLILIRILIFVVVRPPTPARDSTLLPQEGGP